MYINNYLDQYINNVNMEILGDFATLEELGLEGVYLC